MLHPVSGVILAGGKSSRLGRNKAFLEIGGKRIIDRQIELFQAIFMDIKIVCKKKEEYNFPGHMVMEDIVGYSSPLSGIYTGLKVSNYENIFVVACDMPFLNIELIEYQLSFAGKYDVIVPVHDGNFEVLHTVYSKGCIPFIETMFRENNFRIYDFYKNVKLKIIDHRDIQRFDPEKKSFININTKEEFEKISKGMTQKVSY